MIEFVDRLYDIGVVGLCASAALEKHDGRWMAVVDSFDIVRSHLIDFWPDMF